MDYYVRAPISTYYPSLYEYKGYRDTPDKRDTTDTRESDKCIHVSMYP